MNVQNARKWRSTVMVTQALWGDPNSSDLIARMGQAPAGSVDLPDRGRAWVLVGKNEDTGDFIVQVFGWAIPAK